MTGEISDSVRAIFAAHNMPLPDDADVGLAAARVSRISQEIIDAVGGRFTRRLSSDDLLEDAAETAMHPEVTEQLHALNIGVAALVRATQEQTEQVGRIADRLDAATYGQHDPHVAPAPFAVQADVGHP